MRIALGLATLALTVAITGCGGPSDADKQQAKDYCGSSGKYALDGMGLDPYRDKAGYDQCVNDAAKVTACLDVTATKAGGGFVPANCDDGGFKPIK